MIELLRKVDWTMKKIVSSFLVICMFLTISVIPVAAATTDTATQDILDFYAAEHMNYIDEMPASLTNEYQDIIELAEQYLLQFYGETVMLSTSENFVLDQYCNKIKLGLFVDLTDREVVEEIRAFTNAAAELYVVQTANRTSEPTTQDSTEPLSSIQPRLNASSYDADAAVAYAYLWTEEGSTLSNPNYHRYDVDCTNFVSQVLHAGGIPQVSGERKSTSSWYYDWGVLARPSYTWSGAHNLYEHLRDYSTNIVRITSTKDLKVGDIISFDTDPDDDTFHIGHTAVVTRKDGNSWSDIYLTYHSTDRVDIAASVLVNDNGYLAYAWSIE